MVRYLATRIVVMQAGRIVEAGSTAQITASPAHPYTRGLLASAPTGRSGARLVAIPGVVPALGACLLVDRRRVLAAVATVVLVGRFLTRPLFRLVAETGMREVFVGFALVLLGVVPGVRLSRQAQRGMA